ncbi:uncharacterized protein LOC130712598 [Lotus japonicus]|uniref:uncharacterized protein LOC130712598 n=1 Tax=Lotus japonicus TaxID=34305 RepID=UPI0025846A6B|nr:uncharacterized protein LOC130712598 [Lotus japonicus]
MIKDCTRIHHLSFLAVLEPRISGPRADKVLENSGFDSFAKSDSVGFSGGWILTVVYASPQERRRIELWEELTSFKDQVMGPWCVVGDFNSVLYESEKVGGAPINRAAVNRFQDCLNLCLLDDLGAKGTPFTWQRGNLLERLDRAVANDLWRTMFPVASVTNIPLPFSDHCAVLIRLNAEDRRPKPFKFLAAWLNHPDFQEQQRNKVEALRNEDGDWIYDPQELKRMLVDYYKNLYTPEDLASGPLPFPLSFPKLDDNESLEMTESVLQEEVRGALFSIGNLKSPGPDGFHSVFFKKNWEHIKDSLTNFVKEVFHRPEKIMEVNQTIIALIPKITSPDRVSQFRPISLCNTSYKVVTKLLASRISKVLPNLISPNQASFVKGRSTMDNVLIFQEVIHSLKSLRGKQGYMAIKLDLEKAYDRLQWPFIVDTMKFFGFDEHFTNIVHHCISSSSMALSWRGFYTESFNPQRGIRQGDPISPYLFGLCIEMLALMIQEACGSGEWKPFKVGRSGSEISHLLFVDDVILLAEASLDQASLIHDVLRKFCDASGQKVSLAKSRVFFSKNTETNLAEQLSNSLEIQQTHNLGMYLGVPLLHSRMTKDNFNFLIDKVKKKLSGWKASSLSFAGRVSLTQSCLLSLPSYVMQTTPIPLGVCKEVEKLCRNFIWGSTVEKRKCHLISWETICSPKDCGGLGFRDLHSINRAYMTKLAWIVKKEPNCLWAKVFKSNSPTWKGICHAWHLADLGSHWSLGDGKTAMFWKDNWIPSLGNLLYLVPETAPNWLKSVSVSFYRVNGEWKKETLQQILPPEIYDRVIETNPPGEGHGGDSLSWGLTSDGKFSLASVHPIIQSGDSQPSNRIFGTIWKFKGPPKVQSFLWKVAHVRLLTNKERMKRRMTSDGLCPRCIDAEETVIHALRDCPHIQQIWNAFLLDKDWSKFYSQGISNWLDFNLRRNFVQRGGLSWPLLFGIIAWQIWKDRCDLVFNNHITLPSNLIIIATSFTSEVTRTLNNPETVDQLHCTEHLIKWSKPEQGTWKLNTDGSVHTNSGRAACGGIIRDWKGAILQGFSWVAEGLALRWSLESALELQLECIIIDSDSSTIIAAMTSTRPCSPQIDVIIDDCKRLASNFPVISFSHVNRKANVAAHKLASDAISYSGWIWWDSPPSCIAETLLADSAFAY